MISIKYFGDNRRARSSACHNAPPGAPMPATVARSEAIWPILLHSTGIQIR
ncbi:MULTISPECIES: hypothetical protein [unclassified Burkholderia]|uniref:hypothetical protein n=1 Tax=unclassified Burkholderia TaxID=2613784 RepID=UPI00162498C0|nr:MULTISPECIES: hypothetical protein [unclassified Burkholderia]